MKIEDTRGVEENKTGKEEKEERAADDNGSARSWKQEAGRRRGCETRHIGRGRPWCRLWASVGGVGGGGGGGRCHQMPLWRCRRSKISSPKSSTDCSSPASVGAAARTKISRGYNRIFRVTVPCEPRRWNLEWQLCESDRGGRLVWSINRHSHRDRPFVTGEKNQEGGRGEEEKKKGETTTMRRQPRPVDWESWEAVLFFSPIISQGRQRCVVERAGSIEARWFARSRDKCARGWTVWHSAAK